MAKLSFIEKLIPALVLIIVLTGYWLFYTNLDLFSRYVVEDGMVEWLTVAGLLAGSAVCLYRFFNLFRQKHWWFLTVTFLMGVLLFFAAGEEVSWGQRILGIKSSEFFEQNNAQGETNLHNLVVNGVKINKLIFSIALSICMGIYLLLMPLLHAKWQPAKRFIDNSGIPVARVYQVVCFVVLITLTSLLKHEKNAELLECGFALLFFMLIRYPKNAYLFLKENSTRP
ncbi:MAG TPA: hypothetical protein VFR58_10860 [Flavisolibacter sp.]|nr:hypothetical protein [Flavisolibacter sp.]